MINNLNLFEEAKNYIPGGVNSPVRSFNAVGEEPFFTRSAKNCYLYDTNNNKYIDYVCSWGSNIVGHAHPYVINQVATALHNGFSFGTPTELEVEFARKINQLLPHIEKFRLVSSGTEAAMSAIRLARGFTNKKYVIKFNGCYHGHSDNLLVKAGSGLATFNNPNSAGVLPDSTKHTLVLEYNDLQELNLAFDRYGKDIACVILEPFAGNMNLVRPSSDFINLLRKLCDEYNSILIFDEVMTGFRVSLKCASGLLGITPDLTILGKVIGGGMPLAGFGGKASIMDFLAPLGPVYQAGTLSGNPIAVSAGLANLELIKEPGFYEHLSNIAEGLTNGLTKLANKYGIEFNSDYVGGMFGFYFTKNRPINFNDVKKANQKHFNYFFHAMLKHGVFFAPSMYEAGFLCAKHDLNIVELTINYADKVIETMKG